MSASGEARRSRGPPSVHTETKQTQPQPTQNELYPRRAVKFDAIPEDNVYSLDVYSMHGLGKTHFACAHPPKVLLGDTENKAHTVVKKFRGLVDWKRVNTFEDFRQLCYLAIDSPDIHTVVIDSGDDIQDLAAKEWCVENHQKAVFPIVNFRYVYKKIDELTLQLEEARKWFISTSRMKEEWVNDVSTGRMIRDGYKKWESVSLICVGSINIHVCQTTEEENSAQNSLNRSVKGDRLGIEYGIPTIENNQQQNLALETPRTVPKNGEPQNSTVLINARSVVEKQSTPLGITSYSESSEEMERIISSSYVGVAI